MKQIKFEEFIKSKKFEEEVSKLKQITKKLIKNLNSDDKFKDKIYLIKKSNLNNFYDDEINEIVNKKPSLLIIMPFKIKNPPITEENMFSNNENLNSVIFSFQNNESEYKKNESVVSNYIDESCSRQSIFSKNDENLTIKYLNNDIKIDDQKVKSDSNIHEFKLNDNNESLPNKQALPIEKKNFTDIIKNKILKINNENLCTDFNNYLTIDKFYNFVDSYMKIKIFKNSLEQIKMPPFRNFTKNSFEIVKADLKRKTSTVSIINPIIKNQTRYYILVFLLIVVLIVILVFIIILLKKD